MPKIAAPTVAEHREHIRVALIDAAEAILRAGEPLTAGVVSGAAGIARNSIYRYVDSVDDLRGLVLQRYLPAWDTAVTEALAPLTDPGDRVVEWVRINLEQAHLTGHGWLITMTREAPQSAAMTALADHAHRIMRDALGRAWMDLLGDPTEARIMSSLTLGMLGAAFQQLDTELPYGRIVDASVTAARALVDSVPQRP
ncbi:MULTISPECIES: TetR/AcrR family transcriptional regulator [Tessaracoccus]|uniref:TetR/AcrR family transcriptional regulator n=2 Tax=Tessaracoccus TaxID=72763 RepID=A0ABY8PYX0_9ACTN|nr:MULTISPECIES: TetR/AcrR family transcriptional regulator [Tessaracoccus]QXT62418.1 TetR/AcrR family transcriptional regulator [Tessaracoccus palaemonis]WGT47669.1 TetR/AcrR family transcriptional regulator [Tessaracoccus sp. T21]